MAAVVALDTPLLEWQVRSGLDSRHLSELLVFALLFVASCILFPRFVRRFARPAPPQLQTRAVVVVVLGLVLAAIGAIGSTRRPDPSRYLAAQPIVATIPGTTARTYKEPRASERVGVVLGRTIHRVCNAHLCWLALTHRASDSPIDPNDTRIFGEAIDPWTIRYDEPNRLLLVQCKAKYITREQAIGFDDLAQRRVSAIVLAPTLAPPRGWLVGAMLGAMIGMFAMMRASAAQRRLERLRGWRAGQVSALAIELSDGTLVERPAGTLTDGAVLVDLVDEDTSGHAYRDGRRPVAREVFEGSRNDAEARFGERAHAAWTLAIAAVLLLAGPLFVAAAFALVRP